MLRVPKNWLESQAAGQQQYLVQMTGPTVARGVGVLPPSLAVGSPKLKLGLNPWYGDLGYLVTWYRREKELKRVHSRSALVHNRTPFGHWE